MLKQLSMPQKIFGAIVLLFAWLSTELAAADTPTGTIAFLSDRDLPPLFNDKIKVYLIDTDGKNQQRLTENRHDDIDSARFDPGFAVTPKEQKRPLEVKGGVADAPDIQSRTSDFGWRSDPRADIAARSC